MQVDALAAGLENIVMPGVDSETTVASAKVSSNDFNWGLGELEWEAEMRNLDLQVNECCVSFCCLYLYGGQ